MSKKKTLISLVLLLLAGLYLRSGIGLRWDDGQHLHPDERFLSMVTNDIRLPKSLGQYLDSPTSPLSPYNTNFSFFVYGTFPIFLTKIVCEVLGMTDFGSIPLVGRVMSALFDLATVFLVFLIGCRLYSRSVGLLAAALLTFTVLNIQLSHFYGVESYSAFFVVLTFYLGILAYKDNSFQAGSLKPGKQVLIYLLLGISFGLALASKISSLYLLPTLGIIAFFPIFNSINPRIFFRKLFSKQPWKQIFMTSFYFFISMIAAAFTFRFFQPYAFQGSSIFDFTLADKFISNMNEIRGAMKGADMPPSIQWVNRPIIWFSLYNLVVWQMGLFLGVAVCCGVIYMLSEILFKQKYIHIFPVSWSLFWFFNQSTQFVKAGRYLSIIYPFLAIIAAYFLLAMSRKIYNYYLLKVECRRRLNLIAALPWLSVLVFTILWAFAFTSIYSKPHSRVTASNWIYENIPCRSKLANEHWDDGLPLRVGGRDGFGGCYVGVEFNHYWIDDQKKFNDTLGKLADSDYIILSSNRLYMSIPRLPKRFPFTIEYYRMLFSGELGFDRIKTFSSYPEIFGVQFNSDYAEEPFTVYDHPKVYIFKKNPQKFDLNKIRQRLASLPPGVQEPLTAN